MLGRMFPLGHITQRNLPWPLRNWIRTLTGLTLRRVDQEAVVRAGGGEGEVVTWATCVSLRHKCSDPPSPLNFALRVY